MNPKRRIIPVFVPHIGCENNCVFCNQRQISGITAPASSETVRTVIDSLSGQDNSIMELAFYGGSFTAIPVSHQNKLLEAAQSFLAINPGNSIRISTRPDCIDEDTVLRLRRFGVETIEIGAQSMSEEVLCAARRGHSAEDVEKASRIIKAAGLSLILQMMTGLPRDTRERSVYTAERFVQLKPDGVRIYPAVIVRDTELYVQWRRGEYREHTVEEAVTLCAELYEMFESAEIPIIRLGLNPTDELTHGAAAAGAYHPALGELVRSRVYLNKALRQLANVTPGSSVILHVSKNAVSMMIGQKRCNIEYLRDKLGLHSVKVTAEDFAARHNTPIKQKKCLQSGEVYATIL